MKWPDGEFFLHNYQKVKEKKREPRSFLKSLKKLSSTMAATNKRPTDQTKPHKRSKSLLSSRLIPDHLPLEVWKSGISPYLGLRDVCLSAATCKTLDLASKFRVEHNVKPVLVPEDSTSLDHAIQVSEFLRKKRKQGLGAPQVDVLISPGTHPAQRLRYKRSTSTPLFTGALHITKPIQIAGSGREQTFIEANAGIRIGCRRKLTIEIESIEKSYVLQGLTVLAGSTTAGKSSLLHGIEISNCTNAVFLEDVGVSHASGDGIHVSNSTEVTISKLHSTNNFGEGVCFCNASVGTVLSCDVRENHLTGISSKDAGSKVSLHGNIQVTKNGRAGSVWSGLEAGGTEKTSFSGGVIEVYAEVFSVTGNYHDNMNVEEGGHILRKGKYESSLLL